MKTPKLSDRLMAVASLVTAGNCVCDVGCDHGFTSIYLAASGTSPRVIAMDVRDGPLAAAARHIAAYQLQDCIETRLSDGLTAYEPGEAQTLILAGMGGPLMLRILEAFPEKTADFQELILQPQSEIALFRKRLRELGFTIIDERMVLEDGKYYPMMKAVPASAAESAAMNGRPMAEDAVMNEQPASETTPDGGERDRPPIELQDCYGPILLERKDPVLRQYLLWERGIIDGILQKKSDLEHWKRQSERNDRALHIVK